MAIPSQEQWQGEHVRVTFFGDPVSFSDLNGVWKLLMGKEPETRNVRPQEGIVSEEGAWGDRRVTVNQAVGRVDVLISAMPVLGWPTVGDTSAAFQQLRELLAPNLGHLTRCTRVALGGASIVRTTNRDSAYGILESLLPDVRFNEGLRDLFVQMNYQRTLKSVDGVAVNRIGKWFAGVISVAQIQSPTSTFGTIALGDMVRCEMDINTAPEVKLELTADTLRNLLAEMQELALGVLHEGARP